MTAESKANNASATIVHWRTFFTLFPSIFLSKNLCNSLESQISSIIFFSVDEARRILLKLFWNLKWEKKIPPRLEDESKNEDIVEHFVAEKIKAVLAWTHASYLQSISMRLQGWWGRILLKPCIVEKYSRDLCKNFFLPSRSYSSARLRKTQLCHKKIHFFQLNTANLLLENACWMLRMAGRKNGENEMLYLCWVVERQYRKCIIVAAKFHDFKALRFNLTFNTFSWNLQQLELKRYCWTKNRKLRTKILSWS